MYEEQRLFEFVEGALGVLIGGDNEGEFVGVYLSFWMGLQKEKPPFVPNAELMVGERAMRWIVNGTEYLLSENGVYCSRSMYDNKYRLMQAAHVGDSIQLLLETAIMERDRVFPVLDWARGVERDGSTTIAEILSNF